MNTVCVLVITTKYGQDISAWNTREKAVNSLYEFVDEWWDWEEDPNSMDTQEAIDLYFERNQFNGEYYEIAELIIG